MFCSNCGKELPDNAAFCPECGAAQKIVPQEEAPQAASQEIPAEPIYSAPPQTPPQAAYQQPFYQQPPYQQTAPPPNYAPPVVDSGSFGWAVLGFFFPIVGLILFLVWKDQKPLSSKKAGIGALVGVILSVVFYVLVYVVIFGAAMMMY